MKNGTFILFILTQRLKKFSRKKIALNVAFFYGFNFQFIVLEIIFKKT